LPERGRTNADVLAGPDASVEEVVAGPCHGAAATIAGVTITLPALMTASCRGERLGAIFEQDGVEIEWENCSRSEPVAWVRFGHASRRH
jgi:hypothetical protein